jgi:outer membrane protein OmpA-like peptidoglycan-associated protein
MKKLLLYLILFFCVFNSKAQDSIITTVDTLKVYFEIDSFDLDAKEKQLLDGFASIERDSIGFVKLYAFCDYLGTKDYNLTLAKQRAEQVKSLFQTQGIETNIKSYPIGQQLAKSLSETKGNSKNRRVDVFVEHHRVIKQVKPVNETSRKIQKLAVGDQFVVKGMNFIGGQHFLTEGSKPKLDKLYKALEENPNIHIEIQGHICCQEKGDGTDHHTGLQNLSVARAQYVYDKLIEMGIDAERLSYKGFGASKKLYPEERTTFQQQQNRRVEILITKK